MKITLEQMVRSSEPLTRLVKQQIPITTTFKLRKLIKEIQENLKIHDDSRTDLLKKYGTEESEGVFKIEKDQQEDLDKEYKELISTEIDSSTEQISASELGDIVMSTEDSIALEWLIVE